MSGSQIVKKMPRASIISDFPPVPMDPDRPYDAIRELYLLREPDLFAALLRGDRPAARKIINLILVHIYTAGGEQGAHGELLKGLLLELVVMMARASVQAGVAQTEVLGLHFRHLAELATIDDDEDLSAWLCDAFERIFSAVESHGRSAGTPERIIKALDFMRSQLDRDVTREEVACHIGVSPGHFAFLLRAHTGMSFSEQLRHLRIETACELLRRTENSLADIAAACGFCDQSYFTHVFRDLKAMTPRQYRMGGNKKTDTLKR